MWDYDTMTELELFQAFFYDSKEIMPIFKNRETKNAYFDNLPYKKVMNANFNKIGEPLIVKMSYLEASEYNYGRVKIGFYWFYFSVIDLSVNEQGRTIIHYEMDYWLTFCEESRFVIDNALIHRRPLKNANERKTIPRQPFSPMRMQKCYIEPLTTGCSILLSLSQIKIGGNYQKGLTYFCIPSVGAEEVENLAVNLFSNYFINTDIIGAWLCPFEITTTMMNGWSDVVATGGKEGYYTKSSVNINGAVLMPEQDKPITINGFFTDEMTISGFCDAYGNILWTIPFHYYNFDWAHMQIHMSAQTCQLEVILHTYSARYKVYNTGFTYACPTIDVVLNNWSDYCARTREYEMQSRKLQNDQALVGAVTQAGAGAMTGALIGSAVPVIGTAVGAVAGAVSSVAVSGVQYAVNNSYSPKFQNLEDERYKLTQDTLSLSGTSLLEYLKTMVCVYAFKLQGDNYSVNRMLDDVGTFGYYVSETRNGNAIISIFKSSSLTEGGLQMDMSINGTIPEAWKGKIAERFSNGVIMKKIGTW